MTISAFFIIVAVFCLNLNSFAEISGKSFPFTASEDRDGSRMLWFLLNVSGLKATKHAYVSVKDIPKSNRWLKLNFNVPLQPADIAWWPNAVAMLINKENNIYRYRGDEVPLSELVKKFGSPEYRRFNTAEKPLALVVFEKNKKASIKIPAILPETDLYASIFDLAINTRGQACNHNPDDVWVGIADTDENRVYEIDSSGCITGENRKVDKQFSTLINEMNKSGVFK